MSMSEIAQLDTNPGWKSTWGITRVDGHTLQTQTRNTNTTRPGRWSNPNTHTECDLKFESNTGLAPRVTREHSTIPLRQPEAK